MPAPPEIVPLEGERPGAAALRDGRRVGFVAAALGEDAIRGRHAWCGLDDHALDDDEDADLYRDLYALAGSIWLEQGAPTHVVVVPAIGSALGAWLDAGFAKQQVLAERSTAGATPGVSAAVAIRRGGANDLETALRLADLIWHELVAPPAWSEAALPAPDELRSAWEEFLDAPGSAYFVAEQDGKAVGHAALEPGTETAVKLLVAATVPSVRGTGVGVALTEHLLAWARAEGYDRCLTDWRQTNLTASRFWPRRGFRPTAYRLLRIVRPARG